jgi:perosamine synthetase
MRSPFTVSAFPAPRLRNLLRVPNHDGFPVYANLHDSGRAALYWGCRGLDFCSGKTAWLPSFHCGVEVDAVSSAGFNVGFYRVTGDLDVDLEDLDRKVRSRSGVVLVTHYFGFPQPGLAKIAALCGEFGSVLIEDCAHGLFSGSIGATGAMSIFSIRKSLPVYDGGALQVRPDVFERMNHTLRTPLYATSRSSYALCAKSLIKGLLRKDPLACNESAEHFPPIAPVLEPNPHYVGAFSALSRQLAKSHHPSVIVAARRRNYQRLDSSLRGTPGYKTVFPQLPSETCPLFLPIWTSNRSELMRLLREDGIETFRFGATAHRLLPDGSDHEAERLRNSILGIPIHQCLELRQIDWIADRVRQHLFQCAYNK